MDASAVDSPKGQQQQVNVQVTCVTVSPTTSTTPVVTSAGSNTVTVSSPSAIMSPSIHSINGVDVNAGSQQIFMPAVFGPSAINPQLYLGQQIPRTSAMQNAFDYFPFGQQQQPPIFATDHQTPRGQRPLRERETLNQIHSAVARMLDTQQQSSFKLKELKIEKFKGDVLKYKPFRESLRRSLRESRWSEEEKFLYLREHLQDEALELISYLEITRDSYGEAFEILDNEYLQPRLILQTVVDQIMDPEFKVDSQTKGSIRKFKTKFEGIRGNIKLLKIDVDQLLQQICIWRMDGPAKARLEDFLGYNREIPSLSKFHNFLQKENAAQSFLTSGSVSKVQDEPSACLICKDEGHSTLGCPAYLYSERQEELLMSFKICVSCGQHKDEPGKPCNYFDQYESDNDQNNQSENSDDDEDVYQENRISKTFLTTKVSSAQSATASLQEEINGSVLIFPTAFVSIQGQKGIKVLSEPFQVRAILDECSEESYVEEKLLKVLKLEKLPTHVTVQGVGPINTNVKNYVKLQLIQPSGEKLSFHALIVKGVTGKVPARNAEKSKLLSDVELADSNFNIGSETPLMLGGDVVRQLFIHDSKNLIVDHLVLKHTKLGYIVSGRATNEQKPIMESSKNNSKLPMMRVELNGKLQTYSPRSRTFLMIFFVLVAKLGLLAKNWFMTMLLMNNFVHARGLGFNVGLELNDVRRQIQNFMLAHPFIPVVIIIAIIALMWLWHRARQQRSKKVARGKAKFLQDYDAPMMPN